MENQGERINQSIMRKSQDNFFSDHFNQMSPQTVDWFCQTNYFAKPLRSFKSLDLVDCFVLQLPAASLNA